VTTDSEIIRGSRADPRRFGELFDRHARSIHRYARARTNESTADDVVGETFLLAFERRETFDQTWSDAAPWLFGIATNLIRRHHRAEARSLRALEKFVEPAESGDDTAASAARLDAASAVHELGRTLRRMPAIDRDTLLLYAWADLTYEQIAAAMDVPIGTVRSRLNRARRTLQGTDALTALNGGTNGSDHASAPTR
jgi:RNA polymerase sigma factor (sigma-70 family)